MIGPDTREIGCGPVNLDVEMARRQGWSERVIQETWEVLSSLSKKAAGISHAPGPVEGCSCEACDDSTPDADLMQGSAKAERASWRQLGTWPREGSR